jgi:hypothetical protein
MVITDRDEFQFVELAWSPRRTADRLIVVWTTPIKPVTEVLQLTLQRVGVDALPVCLVVSRSPVCGECFLVGVCLVSRISIEDLSVCRLGSGCGFRSVLRGGTRGWGLAFVLLVAVVALIVRVSRLSR